MVEQPDVERFKAMAAYVEETIERQRDMLEREELRRRERELEEICKYISQLEEDLFARDVLRDLEGL